MTMERRTQRTPRLDDRQPGDEFLADALAGLSRQPRQLPSKYFYDARGSRLFEQICGQPEYYPTRVELAIMRAHIDAIAAALGPRVRLVEYGSGAGTKTRLLLRHLRDPVAYVPVEISRLALAESAARFGREFPAIEIVPVCADFTQPDALPRAARTPGRTVVYFPGSTLGNFVQDDAVRLLRRMRAEAGRGGGEAVGGVLLGLDLIKDAVELQAAYNDAAGVTAEFTLNLLVRMNRELGADFDLAGFRHRARWHPLAGHIETSLISLRAQRVRMGAQTFAFKTGEPIVVEHSCKYSLDGFARLAARAGLRVVGVWTDAHRRFSVQWLVAA